jgi:hypothetical protein
MYPESPENTSFGEKAPDDMESGSDAGSIHFWVGVPIGVFPFFGVTDSTGVSGWTESAPGVSEGVKGTGEWFVISDS